MSENNLEKRKKIALDAIKKAYDKEGDDDINEVKLFITHHLDELDESYWKNHFSGSIPEPVQILQNLEFKSSWGDDYSDNMDTIDFTLPGDVTDYVLSVYFDENGQVDYVTMES